MKKSLCSRSWVHTCKSTHCRVAVKAGKVGAQVKEQTLDSAGENMTLTMIQDTLLLHTQSTHLKTSTPLALATTICTFNFQSEIPTRHQIPFSHSCHKLWVLQNMAIYYSEARGQGDHTKPRQENICLF